MAAEQSSIVETSTIIAQVSVWHEEGQPYANFASNYRQVVLRVVRFAAKAGIKFRPFRFHDLRHLHAGDWLRSGRSIYDLQMRLGHLSLKVTEMYLDFLTPEEQIATKKGAAANEFRVGEGIKVGTAA